jgi:hypothetical protein
MRFRKKYTPEEAKSQIEVLKQKFYTNTEVIIYLKRRKNKPLDRIDIFILTLVNRTLEEAIEENVKQNKYILEKIKYIKQFV